MVYQDTPASKAKQEIRGLERALPTCTLREGVTRTVRPEAGTRRPTSRGMHNLGWSTRTKGGDSTGSRRREERRESTQGSSSIGFTRLRLQETSPERSCPTSGPGLSDRRWRTAGSGSDADGRIPQIGSRRSGASTSRWGWSADGEQVGDWCQAGLDVEEAQGCEKTGSRRSTSGGGKPPSGRWRRCPTCSTRCPIP